MSHVPGLELWREAPPLLGPLLSPFSTQRLRVLPDAALQSRVPHHQFRWVRGLEEDATPTGRWRGERHRGSPSGKDPAGWRRSWCWVGHLEPGQRAGRRGEERRGLARAVVRVAASPGATGCGAGGGPSPGISGDRVTEFTEWERSGTAGLAARPGPSPPPLTDRGRRQCRPCAQ